MPAAVAAFGSSFNGLTVPVAGVPAGSYLIICTNHVGGTVTITGDSRGNTYSLLGDAGGNGNRVKAYGAPIQTALVSGDTITRSTSGSPSNILHVVEAVSNVDLLNPIDQSLFTTVVASGGSCTSTPAQTPTSENACSVAFFSASSGAGGSIQSPYTQDQDISGSGFHSFAGHRNLGAIAGQQPVCTETAIGNPTFGVAVVILRPLWLPAAILI